MLFTTFTLAVFFAIITPGPGVLTSAGIGANFGFKPGLRFVTGLFIGNNGVYLAVALGIFSVLETLPTLRLILAIASLLYFFYLAMKIAFAGTQVAFINPTNPPGIVNGVLLQFINPKAYAVNAFFLTNFPLFPENPTTEIAIKCLVINLFWIPIHFGWLSLGIWIQRLELSNTKQRLINITMSITMLLVVVLAILANGL